MKIIRKKSFHAGGSTISVVENYTYTYGSKEEGR